MGSCEANWMECILTSSFSRYITWGWCRGCCSGVVALILSLPSGLAGRHHPHHGQQVEDGHYSWRFRASESIEKTDLAEWVGNDLYHDQHITHDARLFYDNPRCVSKVFFPPYLYQDFWQLPMFRVFLFPLYTLNWTLVLFNLNKSDGLKENSKYVGDDMI